MGGSLSVRANEELVKDVLTCTALTPSTYKAWHPDDMDDPDAVGGSSEDETEGMEEVLGVYILIILWSLTVNFTGRLQFKVHVYFTFGLQTQVTGDLSFVLVTCHTKCCGHL